MNYTSSSKRKVNGRLQGVSYSIFNSKLTDNQALNIIKTYGKLISDEDEPSWEKEPITYTSLTVSDSPFATNDGTFADVTITYRTNGIPAKYITFYMQDVTVADFGLKLAQRKTQLLPSGGFTDWQIVSAIFLIHEERKTK